MRALLVRLATCAPAGRVLAGRREGVQLSDAGRAQAASLAERVRHEGLAAVYASPLERTAETAEVIARAAGIPMRTDDAFIELDFGDWTGREIASLRDDRLSQRYLAYRSGTRPPSGELSLEAQARAVTGLYALTRAHPNHAVAIVTHAEIIRGILGHCLGIPLDLQQRVEIAPASLSIVELDDSGPRVARVNEIAH